MAQQLEYDAKVDPTVSAHEELEALIETLHASGTLRVLNGFFGRFADISEVAMDEVTKPEGQRALANAALLRLLHDPETRRGLYAGLTLVRSLGGSVPEELEDHS